MPQMPPQDRWVNVSGAFDNCFFHAYGLYVLTHNFPLPADLFTFRSILGHESPASQLQQRFTSVDDLSLFGDYAKHRHKVAAPQSNHFVEKTLVLGILLREYFATKMADAPDPAARAPQAVAELRGYLAFRRFGIEKSQCQPTVLVEANQLYLESLVSAAATDDEVATLTEYWRDHGRQNYYRHMATLKTKLAASDVLPMLTTLRQFTVIHTVGQRHAQNNLEQLGGRLPDPFVLEVQLDSKQGHYFLKGSQDNAVKLAEYEKNHQQYLADRASLLALATPALKQRALKTSNSLLLGAILPSGHINKEPVDLLLSKISRIRAICPANESDPLDSLQTKPNYFFLLQAGAVLFAVASAAALVVAALALSSLITLATGGVGAAIAIGAATSLTGFGLYKLCKNTPDDSNDDLELGLIS